MLWILISLAMLASGDKVVSIYTDYRVDKIVGFESKEKCEAFMKTHPPEEPPGGEVRAVCLNESDFADFIHELRENGFVDPPGKSKDMQVMPPLRRET